MSLPNSTLLQGILDSIPGYLIRGENRNSLFRLFQLSPSSWDLGIYTEYVKQYAGLHAPVVDIRGAGVNLLGAVVAAMSAMSPGRAARTTGLVKTSRAAATIARTSPTMSPSGVASAVGATGNAASWTSSALLDHRRYSAVFVVPARWATAAIVRFA